MPWQIGIDEAGYGPNLGPLVQTAVGAQFAVTVEDLWKALSCTVRRFGKGHDNRLFVDDSKKVYGGGRTLKSLELTVLAVFGSTTWPLPFIELLQQWAPHSLPELQNEPWFDESQLTPVAASPIACADAAGRLHNALERNGLRPFWIRGRVTSAALFNTLLAERDNKADVLAHGLRWLIGEACAPDESDEPVSFAIDRLGGRLYHSNLLESACGGRRVEAIEETPARSQYRLTTDRELHWSFEVEAESRHFTVALASMISKYLREVLMIQFNRFWQTHVRGLRPTAGYPTDAARFRAAIEPTMATLQISDHVVWRRK